MEPVVQRTFTEQLLSLSPAERVTRLSERLCHEVAALLGVTGDCIPPDAPFGQLNAEWTDPEQVRAALLAQIEELVGRPFHGWELWRWPYDTGPIGSIRELAQDLADELAIPVPTEPFVDPAEGGQFHWPLPAPPGRGAPKNRPAVFVLSGPRSGSTLLRVMLTRHPALYCGPELHLLPFENMAERHRLLNETGYPWMHGGLRQTLSLVYGLAEEGAAERVQQLVEDAVPIQDVYRLLQSGIGERLLVDKSPSYVWHPAWLARAEDLFEEPKYVYLTRHPCAVIESFVRMRFHWLIGNHFGVWDENPWLFAEKGWAAGNRRTIDYLGGIPPRRQHWVRYEELVTDPETVISGICAFLGIPFDQAMAGPYRDMHTDWQLGDVNLQTYRRVDPALDTAWRRNPPPHRLSPCTQDIAGELGYVLEEPFCH